MPRARSEGLVLLALAIPLAACGGSRPEAREPSDEARPERSAEATADPAPRPPASTRDLPAHATFADLVAAARTLDDRRDQESDAGCLVRVAADGFTLAADLAVAVRPLPTPPGDLDERLRRAAAPVRVLTRYGGYGAGAAELGLVAIATTLPPTRGHALALFLTGDGLYARRTDQPGGERDASRVEWILEHIDWSAFDLVAVTAEAAIPVRQVVELLERLPASLAGRITLAVPLEEGTRLPDAPPAVDAAEHAELCPDGLPELPESDALGELSPDRIRAGLGPLRSAAELCVGTSTGAGAAGGRVAIAVRIAADGRVREACVMEDATGDPVLRACIVRAARELAFDPPGGAVDFALPLLLEAGRTQRQAPLCR